MRFNFVVNIKEISDAVNLQVGTIYSRVVQEVEKLSIAAHAFILNKANTELNSFLRKAFLGENNQNLYWTKIGDKTWVITLDASAMWIEKGTEARFMKWLLTKNRKARTARDGSRYAYIPLTHARLSKTGASSMNQPQKAFENIIKQALKEKNISLTRLDRHKSGEPKIGIVRKVELSPKLFQHLNRPLFSAPRDYLTALRVGLRPHGGIFYLKNLYIIQRPVGKKVVREAITFRTISSKHELEGNRWIAPKIPPFNSLQAAYNWASQEWESIKQALIAEFKQGR